MKKGTKAISMFLFTVLGDALMVNGVAYAGSTNSTANTQLTSVTVDVNTISDTTDQWVTPDGRYILGAYTNHSGEYLEDMRGRKYRLPPNVGFIGQSTLNGDVVMESLAGGTEDVLVFRPGTGVIKRFPDSRDPFAKAGVGAQSSVKGHWVELVSELPGAEPMQEWWLDVDGRPIPLLSGATQAVWSPNGVVLATVLPFDTTKKQGWFALYDAVKQQRQLLGVPVTLTPESPRTNAEPDIQWSSDGKWVALRTANGLEISYVSKGTGDATALPFDNPTTLWGWSSKDTLLTIDTGDNTSTARYFHFTGQKWASVAKFSLPSAVSSYRVTNDQRQILYTDAGDIDLLDGKRVARLANRVNTWWYDTTDDYVYFGIMASAVNGVEKIYRLKVPR